MTKYPLTLKSKHGAVVIYEINNGRSKTTGKVYTAYVVRWRRGKKRFQEKCSDPNKALEWGQRALKALNEGEEMRSQATEQRISYLLACEQALQGRADLMDAVQFWLKQHGGTEDVLVPDAVDKYLASQGKRGLSESHRRNVELHTRTFKEAFNRPIRMISVEDVNGFLEQVEDLCYRKNRRRVLIHFFRWAKSQGYLPQGLPTAMEQSTVPQVKKKSPGIFTPEEMEKLLREAEATKPGIIPYLAIAGFAGIRCAEICRLKAEDINYKQSIIPLTCEITKTNQVRTVKMPQNLVKWLKAYPPSQKVASEELAVHEALRKLCRRAGVVWKHNALRHSFVTYMLQISRDPSGLAEQCGHSMYVASANYKALSDPETAAEWFAIEPSTNPPL